MEQIEQRSFRKNLIVVSVIAEVFSSFTLWLIESEIKYSLFVIETLSIIIIFIILNNYDFKFTQRIIITKKIPKGLFLDITLIYSAAILIILNVFHINETTIQLTLAFLSTSVLSGYALLNICKIQRYFSNLEILVLSFLISFILSGFCTLILLWADENIRSVIIPSAFIVLGIASSIIHLKTKDVPTIKINSLSKNIDVLAIALCIAFYAVIFYYLYPDFTLIGHTDISRHYQDSIILTRTPDLYIHFNYILFHSFGSTLNILSGSPTMSSFLSIQVILNFFLPISVYVLAKRFLADIDRRIPAISIVFYTILSNFSFIYFTHLKALGNQDTEFNLLRLAAEKGFNGTINFAQPFPWFVPLTVAFIMFICAFLLLRVWEIPKSRFVPLYTVLILAMYLTHVSEVVFFVVILSIYSMFSKNKSLRLDDALLSSLIAIILAAIALVYPSIFWTSSYRIREIGISPMLAVILPLLLVMIAMIWRNKMLYKIDLSMKFINNKRFFQILSMGLVTMYLFGFLTWFFIDDFKTSLVYETGVTPWFIYPLALGIVGLLALVALRHLGHILPNSPIAIILVSIALLFLIGKAISLVNVNFFFSGYWEKRLLSYIFLFSCLLAPLALVKLENQVSVKRRFFTNISSSVIISLIVLSGFSSMVLQSEYWFLKVNLSPIPQKEFQAINYLNSILQHDPYAFGIAPSSDSTSLLTLSTFGYVSPRSDVFANSKNPEMPLFELSAYDLPHAYIGVSTQDLFMFEGKEGWLFRHLLPTLPIVFSNDEVTIYNATHVSYPRSNSDTTMLVPSDPNVSENSFLYAYDVISKHDHNYTVMFDRDQNALRSKTVVLSYDPPENNNHTDFYDEFSSLDNWRIISGAWKHSKDGMHGSDISGDLNRIILSPVSSKDFTIDTSIRILDADPNVVNYVSIIYSWTDPENYELAEIVFLGKKVYVSFITVKEGEEYSDSRWPGKPTDLGWAPNNLFNVTFSKQGKLGALLLNGTKYLHQDYGKSGYIGLRLDRIHDVVFDHIEINKSDKLNLRDPLDYISYVKSGGNLIVLNTNGYHSISGVLFNMSDPSHEVNKIVMPSGDYLPVDSRVLPTSTSKNVTPLAFYSSSENKSSILIADETVGLGKITYVNIFPIISSFNENKINGTMFHKILDKISGLIDLNTINLDSQNNKVKFNFKEMTGNGNVTVKTTSFVFPDDQFTNLIIQNNDKEIQIANATELNINNYQYATLHGNHIFLANGRGLYGNLELGNSLEIFFENNATLQTRSNNNKSYHFDSVSNIIIQNNSPIHVYAWQPEINVSGETIFNQLNGKILANTITSDQDLEVLGNVSSTLFMSDTETYSNNISVSGYVQQVPSPSQYDEIGSVLQTYSHFRFQSIPVLVVGLLLVPFLVAAILHLFGKSENPRQKNDQ